MVWVALRCSSVRPEPPAAGGSVEESLAVNDFSCVEATASSPGYWTPPPGLTGLSTSGGPPRDFSAVCCHICGRQSGGASLWRCRWRPASIHELAVTHGWPYIHPAGSHRRTGCPLRTQYPAGRVAAHSDSYRHAAWRSLCVVLGRCCFSSARQALERASQGGVSRPDAGA
jgi:hypothetical protein